MGNIIAVDLGGSKLVVGLVSPEGTVLHSATAVLTGVPFTRETLLDMIDTCVKAIDFKAGHPDAAAVGVSVPGHYDHAHGVFLSNYSTGMRDWPIVEDLKEKYHLPVFADNDAKTCAVAEKLFGSCRDTEQYLWVTVSYGCGGAFYLNDRLFRGARNFAGEVGHVPVEFVQPHLCGCGVWGDLEAEASGTAIGRKYLERTGRATDAAFRSKEVSALARQGDKTALTLFREAGYYIGRIGAMAAMMLDIQKMVLGGGVAVYDFDLMKPGIDRVLEDLLIPLNRDFFHVEQTALGYHASLLGAAAVAMEGINA